MTFTMYSVILILLVITIIGLLIWRNRKFAIIGNNKKISIVTGALQIAHILLYFTGLVDKIGQANIYGSFGICAVISIVCFFLSAWMLLPFSNYKCGLKYLFFFLSVLQVMSTVIIFFLPEAGIPPLIKFA